MMGDVHNSKELEFYSWFLMCFVFLGFSFLCVQIENCQETCSVCDAVEVKDATTLILAFFNTNISIQKLVNLKLLFKNSVNKALLPSNLLFINVDSILCTTLCLYKMQVLVRNQSQTIFKNHPLIIVF